MKKTYNIKTGDEVKWKAVNAKITRRKKWITRCINCQEKLVTQGDMEVINQVKSLITAHTQVANEILTWAEAAGLRHYGRLGTCIMLGRLKPIVSSLGRAEMYYYFKGLIFAAQQDLAELELERSKCISLQLDDKPDTSEPPFLDPRVVHKSEVYPTPKGGDGAPVPTA